jgi:phage antirepressor protein
MNNVKIFENAEFGSIRVTELNGEAWFVGKDVADVLGYERGTKAVVDHIDEDDRLMIDGATQSQFGIELGQRGGWLINESGLYSLVLSSKLPTAKKFKRWVTSEVLPSIRKHGAYMTPEKLEEALLDPDTLIRLATDLKQEREKRIEAQAKIETDKPKVLFADAVCASQSSILVGDLAKLLKQNGVNMGQNRLFAYLRDNGYLMKQGSSKNMPTQKSMELGLFEVKESSITNPDGSIRITKTTKVTGKGQVYFVNQLKAMELVG